MENYRHTSRRLCLCVLTLCLLLFPLTACDADNQSTISDSEARVVMREAVDNLRDLRAFRIDVTQGGTPYNFIFQLGPEGFEFTTAMSRAEGAFIAPDNLYANARINFQGLLVNVGLFANSVGQWLRPLSSDWIAYEYAPGFNPRSMMNEGTGFNYAINALTNVQYISTEMRTGNPVLHIRGNATGEVVNSLLFGLLYILEDNATVDVFIDESINLPTELLLTLPNTATDDDPNTFWRIEIYESNNPDIIIDTPDGIEAPVPSATVATHTQTPSWVPYVLWGLLASAIIGAIVTPFVYRRKGRSMANAVVIGFVVGAISSLIGLLLLWGLIPTLTHDPDAEDKLKVTQIDLSQVHPWVVMAFIAIPVFVGSLDLTVVSAFLPELVAELGLPFDTGLDDASWVVTAYLLAYTVSLTFTGRLSDLLGRRRVYVASLLTFIVGSVLVAIALGTPTDLLLQLYYALGQRPDPTQISLQAIIFGRVIQALGAGALVPVSLALVGDIFPPERRARPLGFVAAMDTLGWVLGPVYGGLFMQIMPWEGLFWMNVPLTFLALFSVLYALRKLPTIKSVGIFDLLGTVLIVGALSAMSIGLGANLDPGSSATRIEDLQPLPDYAVPLLLIAALLFVAFIWVESRVHDPLVNLGMFKRRNLAAASVVNLLVGYCLFIGLVSVPILINLRLESVESLNQAALQVGAMLSTLTLPMAFAAVPGGWLSDRIGVKQTILLGLALSIVGFLAIWQTWTIDLDNLIIGLEMALVGVGIGLTFSPVSTAIINSARHAERGVAGAIVLILRLIGMTISISTLSSIMFYRVNALAAAATSGTETLDTLALYNAYSAAGVQVLGEMGLIGAVLAAIALIPALMIDKTVAVIPEEI